MRCDYITTSGQCASEAVSPTRFCPAHSATSAKTMLNQYRITNKMLGDPIERHASADQIKDLRTELAILRTMLEKRLNMIENDVEFIVALPAVRELAVAVQKLAESAHTMDIKLATVVNKQALMSLAQDLIHAIADEILPFAATTVSQEQVDTAVENIGRKLIQLIADKENPK